MNDTIKTLTGVAALAVFLAGMVGWINNIVLLFHSEAVTGMELLRVAGVPIWPLGAVLGWL